MKTTVALAGEEDDMTGGDDAEVEIPVVEAGEVGWWSNIQEVLDALSSDDKTTRRRDLLAMADGEEWTSLDLCIVTGNSPQSIRVLMTRARKAKSAAEKAAAFPLRAVRENPEWRPGTLVPRLYFRKGLVHGWLVRTRRLSDWTVDAEPRRAHNAGRPERS